MTTLIHLTRMLTVAAIALSGAMTAPQAALAQVATPFLQVCMPAGNGKELSSNGCACSTSGDCLGTCSGNNICLGGPDVPVCAAPGNRLDLSSNGCVCTSNADCRFNCSGGLCVGSGPAPLPTCDLPGAGDNASVDGCPCDTSSDCDGNCDMRTRTCGGVAGGVANTPTDIIGVASEVAVLGDQTFDEATILGALKMPSQVLFRLHGPGDDACNNPFFTTATLDPGTGFARSAGVVPPNTSQLRWTATYSGNAWNLPSATACDDPLQQVRIIPLFAAGFERDEGEP